MKSVGLASRGVSSGDMSETDEERLTSSGVGESLGTAAMLEAAAISSAAGDGPSSVESEALETAGEKSGTCMNTGSELSE